MAWIYKFRISLITILAIILIIFAAAFSILRAVLPHATGYAEEVQQILFEQIGLPVSIGAIDADMHWLTPRLKVRDVVVFDEGGTKELVHFNEAIFAMAIVDSILTATPTVGEVRLVGAVISVEHFVDKDHPAGRWTVQGVEIAGDGSKGISKELIAVLENTDILLLDSDIHWIDHKKDKRPLNFIGVDVVSKAFTGKHSLGADFQLPEGYGDTFRFVVEINDLNNLNDLDEVNWNVFLEGKAVNVERLFSALDLEGMPEVDGVLDGKIWLSYHDRGIASISGDVSVNSFNISSASGGREWKTDHLTMKFNVQRLIETWRLDVTDLVLVKNGRIWGDTSDIALLGSRHSGWRASATYLRLQDIYQIPFVFLKDEEVSELRNFQLLKVSGDFYNVEVMIPSSGQGKLAIEGIFDNFDFNIPETEISFQGVDGMFRFEDGQVELELLSESMKIDFGKLFRQPLEASVMEGVVFARMEHDSWVLTSSDLYMQNSDVETNTRFEVTVNDDGAVFTDMQTDFINADVASANKYYAVSLMTDSLVDWLDHGLVDGTIESGSYILHGDASQFPYPNYDGVNEVVFSAQNLTLHFLDGWPDLNDLNGDFRFYNASLSIENATGNAYKGTMKEVKATIPDFESPRMFMQGFITGKAEDLQQYVFNSGLDEILGTAMRQFRASGESRLDLFLEVPLDDEKDIVQTKGKLSFTNNDLYFPVMGYSLSDVAGELSFVGDDLSGTGITAKFEGAPVNINVTGNKGDAFEQTVFNLQGRLPIDSMLKKFDWIPRGWFRGSSDWNIDVRLPGVSDQYSLKIDMQSGLKGVTLNASDALNKASGKVLPTSVGVEVVEEIIYVGLDMKDVVELSAARNKEAMWDFFVDSSLIKGRGEFAEDLNKDSLASLDFEYVNLLMLFQRKDEKSRMLLAPTIFPPMKIEVKDLTWDDWKFKNVHLDTNWYPQGMLIDSLSLQGPSLKIKGQGSWSVSKKNKHESNFKFIVNSDNYGNTLSSMGFTNGLDQGRYSATVDWQWSAEPYRFSLETVKGSTRFEILDGRIKDVKPGAGGRLLGMPLQILKLDFGDVYKEGFSFDSVSGDFEFYNGNAVTENIEINAAPADIGLVGRIGMVKKDYDLVMQVRPKLSATAFTTGTLVGGPIIGTGLLLIKKLFGLDEMLHDEYSVSGTWEKPEVKLISTHTEKTKEELIEEENDEFQ
jgi:uncharacterized protein YhdP